MVLDRRLAVPGPGNEDPMVGPSHRHRSSAFAVFKGANVHSKIPTHWRGAGAWPARDDNRTHTVPSLASHRIAFQIWHGRARSRRLIAATTRATCSSSTLHPCMPGTGKSPHFRRRPVDAALPAAAMPALLVDTDARPASSSDASSSSDRSRKRSESASPNRPPVSPITPKASVAQLAPVERTEAQPRPAPAPVATFRQQPPSVAISESENPDAIALRSAISLLQLQREKSKQDLKALAELKSVAVSDPLGFARSIQQNRAQAAQSYNDVLTPTLANLTREDSEGAGGVEEGHNGAEMRKDSATTSASAAAPKFPTIPQPQNIVRCPPVNWAKYHVVGEPLDKMHEEQKKWPGHSEPPRNQSGRRAPAHAVASPYSPLTDGIGKSSTSSSQTPQPPKYSKKSPS